MPTRKPPVPANADDPAKSQRFIDIAREVEADETPGALARAFSPLQRDSCHLLRRNPLRSRSRGAMVGVP
jgi:hypothetical protein